ncbi:MAG TPA: hypothetical protein PKK76_13240, partial [Leptospiraceae bacterium]|nr:hypothetical protein [Leptospiraceae bacterium]
MRIKLWGVRGSLPTPMGVQEYQTILGHALAHAQNDFRANPSITAEQLYEGIPAQYRRVIG